MNLKMLVVGTVMCLGLGACGSGTKAKSTEEVVKGPSTKAPTVMVSNRHAAARKDPVGRLIDGILDEQDPKAERPIPMEQSLKYDLNGDKSLETVVLIGGAEWCKNACALLVIGGAENPKLLANIKVAQGAVMVTETASKGWHDLVTTAPDKTRQRWQWDGAKYVAATGAVDPKNLGAGLTVFTIAPQAAPPVVAPKAAPLKAGQTTKETPATAVPAPKPAAKAAAPAPKR